MEEKRITSVVIHHMFHGMSFGSDVVAHKVHVYRHGQVKQEIYNGISRIPLREYKYKVKKDEIEAFFKFMEHDVEIESWIDDYSILVCDGYSWSFSIRYSDNHTKKTIGTVEPPPQGLRLEEYIKKLVAFNEEPWLF